MSNIELPDCDELNEILNELGYKKFKIYEAQLIKLWRGRENEEDEILEDDMDDMWSEIDFWGDDELLDDLWSDCEFWDGEMDDELLEAEMRALWADIEFWDDEMLDRFCYGIDEWDDAALDEEWDDEELWYGGNVPWEEY